MFVLFTQWRGYIFSAILTLLPNDPSWNLSLNMVVNTVHRVQRMVRWALTSCPVGHPWIWNNGEYITKHYGNVIMSAMASKITTPTIACSAVYAGADQRKHKSSASLAFVRGILRWPVNSPHKGQSRGKYIHLMTSSWFANMPDYRLFNRILKLAMKKRLIFAHITMTS